MHYYIAHIYKGPMTSNSINALSGPVEGLKEMINTASLSQPNEGGSSNIIAIGNTSSNSKHYKYFLLA